MPMSRRQWLKLGAIGLGYAAFDSHAWETKKAVNAPKGKEQESPKFLPAFPLPADAVGVVERDIQSVSVNDRPFTRWIWIPSGELEDFQALSHGLNTISRSPNIRPPLRISEHVARINLRWYAPRDQDIADWLGLWEKLQFDPWFSLLITKDTIALLTEAQKEKIVFPWKWQFKEGEKWVKRTVPTKLSELKDVVLLRVNAQHLSNTALNRIQREAVSQSPIVHYTYLLARVLSTIKDQDNKKDNVYSTIWGGLYYEFAGIRKAQKGVATDLDQLVADVNLNDGKIPFQKIFDDKLRSDERAAMFKSGVTKKPRAIEWFGINGSRLSQGNGVLFITKDIRKKDVDTSTHAMMNLVNANFKAFEVIWTRANGMLGYALYGENGELLDEADINVAGDSTMEGEEYNLQSAISCIRCHGSSDGWIPFSNEVQTLVKYGRPDIFGDTGNLKSTITDTIDRLVGWYSGDARKPLMRAREDFDAAVLKATGPWKQSVTQVGVVRLSSKRLGEIYKYDRYRQVDAGTALREIGFNAPTDQQELQKEIERVLPPDARAKVGDIYPEDARIGALKAGLKINANDWAFVLSFAIDRANQQRGKQ